MSSYEDFLTIHPVYRSFSNVTVIKMYLFLNKYLLKALFIDVLYAAYRIHINVFKLERNSYFRWIKILTGFEVHGNKTKEITLFFACVIS